MDENEDEYQTSLEIGNVLIEFFTFIISIIFLGFILYQGDPDLMDSIKNFLNSFNLPIEVDANYRR